MQRWAHDHIRYAKIETSVTSAENSCSDCAVWMSISLASSLLEKANFKIFNKRQKINISQSIQSCNNVMPHPFIIWL